MKVILIKFTARRLASDGVCLNRVGRSAAPDVERCQRSLAFQKCYAPYDGETVQTCFKHVEKETVAKLNP